MTFVVTQCDRCVMVLSPSRRGERCWECPAGPGTATAERDLALGVCTAEFEKPISRCGKGSTNVPS
jgi:hypothetical protein